MFSFFQSSRPEGLFDSVIITIIIISSSIIIGAGRGGINPVNTHIITPVVGEEKPGIQPAAKRWLLEEVCVQSW